MSGDNHITQEASNESSTGLKLEFINHTGANFRNPSDETRKRIRSHAQAHYRQQSGRRRQTTVELNTSFLFDHSGEASPDALQATKIGQNFPVAPTPGPLTLLDAGRTDPFASFNVGDGRRAHQLWDHVYDGTCAKFKALDAIGFLGLARETMAISQMLSASAWHLVHTLRCEIDQGDDAKYSVKTAQALRRKLGDSRNATSDEVIITVLAFAAYANLTRNRELFNIHFNGLQQILRHRVDSFLDSTSTLRLAHFWIEVNGRFRADESPQFPQPDQLLASRSRLPFPLPRLVHDAAGETSDFTKSPLVALTFGLLQELNTIFSRELGTRNDIWQDVRFAVYHLSPIMHRLLCIPRASAYDSVSIYQRECFRLACILYIANLQFKFDPEPGIGMLHGSKLKLNLDREEVLSSWGRSNSVLIWILTIATCSGCLFFDLRNHFLGLLRKALRDTDAGPSDSLFGVLNSTAWCSEAFRSEFDTLTSQLNLPP